jgi:hypothetical protein
MSRQAYCREQARLCRELAQQISNNRDAQQLRSMACNFDTEADALERQAAENDSQSTAHSEPGNAT